MSEAKPLTPLMQQYRSVHEKLPKDTVLFFRLGDFYEMFFEDAENCSRILGLTLTQRNGFPMAGIPYHASETYIGKLLQAGKKVAVCDQMEEPKPGKLVERALTRILTPGTVLEETQVEPKANHCLACVSFQGGMLCAAWIDVSTGEFKIASESDAESLLSFLIALDPKEIVLSEDFPGSQRASLLRLLQNRAVSEVPSFLFDNARARAHLEQLFGVQHLDGFGITSDEPALGCADALVFYVTENLRHSPKNLKKISRCHLKRSLLMDASTLQHLEIFQTQRGTKEGSLWAFLDVAKTAAGSRLIQQFLISPPVDLKQITYRQNGIQAFYDEPSTARSLQNVLSKTRDLSRILSRLHNRMRSPRELGAILTTLEQLPLVQTILKPLDVPEIRSLSDDICLFEDLKFLLKSALNEELPNDLSEGGYIRTGYDTTLDELRMAQTDSQVWLQQFEEREQRETGIRNLRVKYNSAVGFFIEVSKGNVNSVPMHYIRKQTLTHYERYFTPELKEKEDLILHAKDRAIEREKEIFATLIATVLEQTERLQATASVLATLDVFAAWSELAHEQHYCRPVVDDSGALEIKGGRHPIVENALKKKHASNNPFVANDLELSTDGRQIMILTGPNMAGKSTFIRQNALIALMAHLGCWVPATSCRIGRMDRICSRVGASDDLACGQSTFMVEMLETANILHSATERTFIILDEIGRGTSTYDGLSIAWSVVEFLHRDEERGSRTLFATHYHELTQLAELYPRIFNMYVSVREWNESILFLHQICPGSARRSYGIQVAKLAGMPEAVIERAKVVLEKLEREGRVLQKLLNEHPTTDATPQLVLFEDA